MSVHTTFVSTDLGKLRVEQRGGADRPRCCGTACSWTRRRGARWSTRSRNTAASSWSTVPLTAAARPCLPRLLERRLRGPRAPLLAELGVDEPVDWVGNAWGGHVGLQLAARPGNPLRTLVTIGTPVAALTRRERAMKVLPLVQLYRVGGPSRFVVKGLSEALIGAEAQAAHPEQAARTMVAFRDAHRPSMLHAMNGLMLQRTGMDPLLPQITTPTLMLAARDDAMGWRPDEARAAAATMPNARVEGGDRGRACRAAAGGCRTGRTPRPRLLGYLTALPDCAT